MTIFRTHGRRRRGGLSPNLTNMIVSHEYMTNEAQVVVMYTCVVTFMIVSHVKVGARTKLYLNVADLHIQESASV